MLITNLQRAGLAALVSSVLTIGFVIYIGLLRHGQSIAHESVAVHSLRALAAAEFEYQRTFGHFTELDELRGSSRVLAEHFPPRADVMYTYRVELEENGTAFRLTAEPKANWWGLATYSIDEACQLRRCRPGSDRDEPLPLAIVGVEESSLQRSNARFTGRARRHPP